jgi:preprotein translocase subunit SecE
MSWVSRFFIFWNDSVLELKRVVWPNRKETMQTTLGVLVMVLVMGLLIWSVDASLIRLITFVLGK